MPRSKRKAPARFVARRILLILIIIAALGSLGVAVWYFGRNLIAPEVPASSAPAESVASNVSEVSSAPVPVSEPPSEPEPEPEPEPGPSPDDWELLLVNPSNPLPEGYAPELETVTDNYRVDARIADSVKRMFAQAKEDGISLIICSAFRSVEYQQKLFDDKTASLVNNGSSEDEAVAVTATIIAVPGTSEHHTGLAMDIVTNTHYELEETFAETPAFLWLSEHAADYGFVMRYPKDKQSITKIIYEPWHYRYVGVENAKRMNAEGLCLEEYIAVLNGEKLSPVLQEPSEDADEPPDGADEPAEGGASGEPDAAASQTLP